MPSQADWPRPSSGSAVTLISMTTSTRPRPEPAASGTRHSGLSQPRISPITVKGSVVFATGRHMTMPSNVQVGMPSRSRVSAT